VNLFPSADYIVALGKDGNVLEHGTFQELNTTDGYVRSFSLQDNKRNSEVLEAPVKLSFAPRQTSAFSDAMDEKKRQLGDMSVYKYWLKAIGATATILFFAYTIIYAGLLSFTSKSKFRQHLTCPDIFQQRCG